MVHCAKPSTTKKTEMKTLKQKIEVMTAADGGARIQMKPYGLPDNYWTPAPFECTWNWSTLDYRVAEPEIAPGHNPDKLTIDQVETHLGWRLLDFDELKDRTRDYNEIQAWRRTNKQWNTIGFKGCHPNLTYRTKLTREQLAALDNPPPPKQHLPLGPEDFPPGNIFWLRHKDWNTNTRTMVTFIGAEKLRYSAPETGYGEMTYSKLADSGYLCSLDGGRTWLPCCKTSE